MRPVDKRSVGRITSQLQDDASKIQAFSGEPVRAMAVAMSSVVIGVVLSFVVRIHPHRLCSRTMRMKGLMRFLHLIVTCSSLCGRLRCWPLAACP